LKRVLPGVVAHGETVEDAVAAAMELAQKVVNEVGDMLNPGDSGGKCRYCNQPEHPERACEIRLGYL
jgi:hypothetical protein